MLSAQINLIRNNLGERKGEKMFPTIETERLLLREISKEDAKHLLISFQTVTRRKEEYVGELK